MSDKEATMVDIKHPVSDNFVKKLHYYQQQNILCDVNIFTRDGCVRAHRLVLAAASPFFSSYEETGSSKNYVCPIDSVKGIQSVLRYVYTGELVIEKSDLGDVYQLSKSFQLNSLVETLQSEYGELVIKKESDEQGLRILQVSNDSVKERTHQEQADISSSSVSDSAGFLSDRNLTESERPKDFTSCEADAISTSLFDKIKLGGNKEESKQTNSEELFMHILSSQDNDSESDGDFFTGINTDPHNQEGDRSLANSNTEVFGGSTTENSCHGNITEGNSQVFVTVKEENVDEIKKETSECDVEVSRETSSGEDNSTNHSTKELLKIAEDDEAYETLECFCCKEVVPSYADLCNHLSEVHQRECFRCTICGEIFETELDRNRHRRKVHRAVNEETQDKQEMKGRQFTCYRGLKKSLRQIYVSQSLKKEKQTTKQKNIKFNCLKCCCEFNTEETFIKHIKDDTCSVMPTDDEDTESQPRVEYFARRLSNTFHVPITRFSSVDTISSKIPSEQKNVINVGSRKKDVLRVTDKKIEGKINVYRCHGCKEEFLDATSCVDHRKEKHPGTAKQNMSCDICGTYQGCWIYLVEHKFKTHGILENPERYLMLKCEYKGCDYITLAKDRLKDHYSKNHGEKEDCAVCGKTVCKGKAMKNHMKSHTDPSVTCVQCGRSFKNIQSLKSHLNMFHTEKGLQQRFMCHLCPTSVRHKEDINEHILQVHKEVPHGLEDKLMSCTKCDFRTLLPTKMKKHQMLHQKQDNPESVQKTPCEVCGALLTPKNYKTHYREVHSEKTIKCAYDGCNFTASTERRMNLHVYNHHTNKDFKPFNCHLCDYRAKLRGNLTKHLANKHKYQDMTLAKRRKIALETGENFPSTVIGNRAIDNDLMKYNNPPQEQLPWK